MWTKEKIKKELERLNNLQPFWHSIRLPFGIFTAERNGEKRLNYNELKWVRIKNLIDPAGKRVLDIGCNEGFFSIEMIKAGAREVHAIDINEHRIEKANFVINVLGISGISLHQNDIYKITDLNLGKFDIALVLGILHRIPDPYTLIKTLTGIADIIVFEWQSSHDERPLMEFWGGGYKKYDFDNSGYWKPTVSCIKLILERHNFFNNYVVDCSSGRAILIASKLEHYKVKEEECDNVVSKSHLLFKYLHTVFKIIARIKK